MFVDFPTGRLYCGDCLEVMKDIPDSVIDMVLCDLPYGTTKCKWDILIPFESLWSQYKRICKGAIVLTGTEPFSSFLRCSNIEQYKYDWTWDKVTARGHLVATKRPMAQTECISVFYNGFNIYNPQMVKRPLDKVERRKRTEYARTEIMGGISNAPTDRVYDEWYPKTIISLSNAGSSVKSVHPTQKPVALFEYLINTYTNPNMIVLDNCIGSGTTAIAAINTGRKWVGIEKDVEYATVAYERIVNHCRAA